MSYHISNKFLWCTRKLKRGRNVMFENNQADPECLHFELATNLSKKSKKTLLPKWRLVLEFKMSFSLGCDWQNCSKATTLVTFVVCYRLLVRMSLRNCVDNSKENAKWLLERKKWRCLLPLKLLNRLHHHKALNDLSHDL